MFDKLGVELRTLGFLAGGNAPSIDGICYLKTQFQLTPSKSPSLDSCLNLDIAPG